MIIKMRYILAKWKIISLVKLKFYLKMLQNEILIIFKNLKSIICFNKLSFNNLFT